MNSILLEHFQRKLEATGLNEKPALIKKKLQKQMQRKRSLRLLAGGGHPGRPGGGGEGGAQQAGRCSVLNNRSPERSAKIAPIDDSPGSQQRAEGDLERKTLILQGETRVLQGGTGPCVVTPADLQF